MMGRPERVDLTVAICTFNRADRYLGGALDSVLCQIDASVSFEVLVVDNASTDATPALIARYERDYPGHVRGVHEPQLGLSHARNRAIAEARAEIVAFLDDDALADPGWVAATIAAWRGKVELAGAVGGPVALAWDCPRPAWLPAALDGVLGRFAPDGGAGVADRLVGCNVSYSRRAIIAIGGFTTILGRRGNLLLQGEDDDICQRLKQAGYEAYFAPAMTIRHIVPKQRAARAYFLRWAVGSGVAIAQMRHAKGNVPRPLRALITSGKVAKHGLRLVGPGRLGPAVRFEHAFESVRAVSELLTYLGLETLLERAT